MLAIVHSPGRQAVARRRVWSVQFFLHLVIHIDLCDRHDRTVLRSAAF